MGMIGRALRWIFAASIFAVTTPILLLTLMVYHLGGAILAGLIATVMLLAILGTVLGPTPNPAEWIIAFPVVLSCMVVGGWMWSERFGLRRTFGHSTGDSHGSARLAARGRSRRWRRSATWGC